MNKKVEAHFAVIATSPHRTLDSRKIISIFQPFSANQYFSAPVKCRKVIKQNKVNIFDGWRWWWWCNATMDIRWNREPNQNCHCVLAVDMLICFRVLKIFSSTLVSPPPIRQSSRRFYRHFLKMYNFVSSFFVCCCPRSTLIVPNHFHSATTRHIHNGMYWRSG